MADGRGLWALAAWTGGRAGREELLEPIGRVHHEDPAVPPLTVAFAPVKGERPEWAVQKLTELGIDRIVPLRTRHAVVRWSGSRGEASVARLRRVAREAAAQSRRVWLPEVLETLDFDDLGRLGEPGQVALAQLEGQCPTLGRPVVAVGPEGGWSTDELGSGLPVVGLGPGVLRAETAAVTAGALLAALRAGLVAPAAPGPVHSPE